LTSNYGMDILKSSHMAFAPDNLLPLTFSHCDVVGTCDAWTFWR
jgi:hypothetical protein